MLTHSRTFWSLQPQRRMVLAIILGLSLLSFPAPNFVSPLRADDKDKEEEEDPLAKLKGLLDPSLAKPLMTTAEEKSFRGRQEPTYMRSALKSLSPSNRDEQLIQEGVRFRVLRLTMPENWPQLGNRTKELINDLDVFADGAPRAREIAARAAVKELGALLISDQPQVVKINAAWLLGRLNIKSIERRTNTPAVPYAPAAEPLIQALGDSTLDISVKIAAVRGLSRILEDGDPTRQLRDQIATALTDQYAVLDSYTPGDGRNWYQFRLIDALGKADEPRSMTQQTNVVDVLWQAMHDESLPWHMRTRAARSLGQIKLDASFNLPLVAHQMVLLAGQLSVAYNNNPNQSQWRLCFSDLYFAFKAQTPRLQQRGWGLLQNPPAAARAVIEGAYQQVLPMVNSVLKDEAPDPVPASLLRSAGDWMNANKPTDFKLHSGAAPLKQAAPAAAPGAAPAEGSTNVGPSNPKAVSAASE